jgi:hypothetical protein
MMMDGFAQPSIALAGLRGEHQFINSFRFQWIAAPTPSVETALHVPNVLATTIDKQLRRTGA